MNEYLTVKETATLLKVNPITVKRGIKHREDLEKYRKYNKKKRK